MGKVGSNKRLHEPVLLPEVLEALRVKELAHSKKLFDKPKFIDATIGLGGHAIEIVRLGADVLGIEADRATLKVAEEHFKEACPPRLSRKAGSLKLIHGNFRRLETIAKENNFWPVDGVLFDLGISSYQLGLKNRGFSFEYPDAPLDMRLDTEAQKLTAGDLLNALNERQLFELFKKILDSNLSRQLARETVRQRRLIGLRKVGDLLRVIRKVVKQKSKLNPATLPFLAVRLAVNSELENLEEALPKALRLLKRGGRLVVITFHSGEDSITKKFFKESKAKGEAEIITKRPIMPKKGEVDKNPRARSAKMRVLEKK